MGPADIALLHVFFLKMLKIEKVKDCESNSTETQASGSTFFSKYTNAERKGWGALPKACLEGGQMVPGSGQ